MNDNFCDITVVLDRSGSMEAVRTDTIGGFNAFIGEQRKQPGKCALSLVQFDDVYEPVYTARPVGDAPLLSVETFVPRNTTALLDALGRTIAATGARLGAMPEADRPGKVLFVIITDGAENASREFTRKQIFEMITQQKTMYQWQFIFLGANQDAIQAGAAMGIARGQTMSYAANAVGTQSAFRSASNATSGYRSGATGQSAAFTEDDREEQKKAGVDQNQP